MVEKAAQAIPDHMVLPTQFTPLLGREQELTQVCSLLRRTEVRLLTLVGTGGVGKTRLALAAAAGVRNDFADGLCFVPLAPVNDPEQVIPTISRPSACGKPEIDPCWNNSRHLFPLFFMAGAWARKA